jgi:UDP-glucose 4-epimerase
VEEAPELARRVNVEGTQNLLEALSLARPRILLFASSAAVYADRSGPIPESSPVGPGDLYGETKATGEGLVAQFGKQTGTHCLVARLFNVIGERETNPHVVPELVRLLQSDSGRTVFNVGSGRGTSVAELVSSCERILGREITVNVDQSRLRKHDRNELIADVKLLRAVTGWAPKRLLDETLRRLLFEK